MFSMIVIVMDNILDTGIIGVAAITLVLTGVVTTGTGGLVEETTEKAHAVKCSLEPRLLPWT